MSMLLKKTYSQLIQLSGMKDRFEYLKLNGRIGERTFGGDRYLNQALYKSQEWRTFRNQVIIRDGGCDMALAEYPILRTDASGSLRGRADYIIIHHINPITAEDIRNRSPAIFDMNNVVCVSPQTHRAIHYGDVNLLPIEYTPRTPNDTCPWKNIREERKHERKHSEHDQENARPGCRVYSL